MRNDFWKGKRVLVTGHTGFKGGWLTIWLHQLGAKVTGISLPPTTTPNLFSLANIEQICESHFCDIGDTDRINQHIQNAEPEIIFHLAAQPLVRASYRLPLETFATNVMGTAHVLDAIHKTDTMRVAIMITTDKVYRNNEWLWPYRENDHLGGHDPYSASKAASEIVIESYRSAFLASKGVAIASARAGNVIGGGDWAEDRLIPDAIRSWQKGEVLEIRRPDSIRPWQHVLEPLAGYLQLGEKLWHTPDLAGAYNFGPNTNEAATVQTVIQAAQKAYGSGEIRFGDISKGPHEAGTLTLDVSKSQHVLEIRSCWSLDRAIEQTMLWYKNQKEGKDVAKLCAEQISLYERDWLVDQNQAGKEIF